MGFARSLAFAHFTGAISINLNLNYFEFTPSKRTNCWARIFRGIDGITGISQHTFYWCSTWNNKGYHSRHWHQSQRYAAALMGNGCYFCCCFCYAPLALNAHEAHLQHWNLCCGNSNWIHECMRTQATDGQANVRDQSPRAAWHDHSFGLEERQTWRHDASRAGNGRQGPSQCLPGAAEAMTVANVMSQFKFTGAAHRKTQCHM